MTATTVSTCIPIYNPNPQHLRELLDSLTAQSRKPEQIILSIDDGTQIPTSVWNELNDFCAEAADGHILLPDGRLGMVGNWNRAVRMSSSDLVHVLGQDDLLAPDFYETVLPVFERGVAAVGVRRTLIGNSGARLTRRAPLRSRERLRADELVSVIGPHQVVAASLLMDNPLGEPSAVVFRRDAYDRVGGYSEVVPHAADVMMNCELAAEFLGFAFVSVPLVSRRLHAGALTHANRASGTVDRDRWTIAQRYGPRVRTGAAAIAYGVATIALLRSRQTGQARTAFRRTVSSVCRDPRGTLSALRWLANPRFGPRLQALTAEPSGRAP